MRKHRFFVNSELLPAIQIDLDPDISHQISRVLRLQEGDLIYLFNNTDYEYNATISNINKKTVTVTITAQTLTQALAPLQIHLGQVLGKGEKMDWVIQKATELGVHSITPLHSERSIKKLPIDRTNSKCEHWQKIAIAASCQSWRTDVPIINPPQNLSDWIDSNAHQQKLILSPHHNVQKIMDLKIANKVSLLIGPEGGFSDNEVALAITKNFQPVYLGPRILRTETAAVAALAILQARFGDL